MSLVPTSKRSIKILPDHLINQIAAGEVVERPASVVKELLDNSLDAGATQINLDIERGGVGLIRVTDNGVGIRHDEIKLALTRHATSKINNMSDFRTLITMGFRGEALPSIASISRLMLTSRSEHDEHAWMVKSEGRIDPSSPEPASHQQGTTIEIRDLFFNVPARRKYLRAERTEFYQIQQLVRHFAISHPNVGVRLSHNGRQISNFKLSIGDHSQRVLAVNGSRFLQHSIEIDTQAAGMILQGWVGKRDAARTMNDSQFFCLNRRCIKDKRINHAIQQAYQGVLPEGRYATYVLNLEIDPAEIDVNVHPAKTEVRFREGRTVHDFIYSTLNSALNEQQALLPEIEPSIQYNNATVSTAQPRRSERPTYARPQQPSTKIRELSTKPSSVDEESASYQSLVQPQEVEVPIFHHTEQIGDVLFYKQGDELLLINAKKAEYELFRQRMMSELEEGSVVSKPLLFPQRVEIDGREVLPIQESILQLETLGIILHFNGEHCQLRQLPSGFSRDMFLESITELIKIMTENESDKIFRMIDVLAKQFADNISHHDRKFIFDQLDKLKDKDIVRNFSSVELLSLIEGKTFQSSQS